MGLFNAFLFLCLVLNCLLFISNIPHVPQFLPATTDVQNTVCQLQCAPRFAELESVLKEHGSRMDAHVMSGILVVALLVMAGGLVFSLVVCNCSNHDSFKKEYKSDMERTRDRITRLEKKDVKIDVLEQEILCRLQPVENRTRGLPIKLEDICNRLIDLEEKVAKPLSAESQRPSERNTIVLDESFFKGKQNVRRKKLNDLIQEPEKTKGSITIDTPKPEPSSNNSTENSSTNVDSRRLLKQ